MVKTSSKKSLLFTGVIYFEIDALKLSKNWYHLLSCIDRLQYVDCVDCSLQLHHRLWLHVIYKCSSDFENVSLQSLIDFQCHMLAIYRFSYRETYSGIHICGYL